MCTMLGTNLSLTHLFFNFSDQPAQLADQLESGPVHVAQREPQSRPQERKSQFLTYFLPPHQPLQLLMLFVISRFELIEMT